MPKCFSFRLTLNKSDVSSAKRILLVNYSSIKGRSLIKMRNNKRPKMGIDTEAPEDVTRSMLTFCIRFVIYNMISARAESPIL